MGRVMGSHVRHAAKRQSGTITVRMLLRLYPMGRDPGFLYVLRTHRPADGKRYEVQMLLLKTINPPNPLVTHSIIIDIRGDSRQHRLDHALL